MATSGETGQRKGGKAFRVLIVDDEQALCFTWERILASQGYKTKSVHHGDEVIEAVRSYKPDVVVLDVKLPGTDGITLCKMLKEQPDTAHTKILLCSGHVDVDLERVRGLADSVARKPVSPNLLLASLAALTSFHPSEAPSSRR